MNQQIVLYLLYYMLFILVVLTYSRLIVLFLPDLSKASALSGASSGSASADTCSAEPGGWWGFAGILECLPLHTLWYGFAQKLGPQVASGSNFRFYYILYNETSSLGLCLWRDNPIQTHICTGYTSIYRNSWLQGYDCEAQAKTLGDRNFQSRLFQQFVFMRDCRTCRQAKIFQNPITQNFWAKSNYQ